ncbi:hypothetical protein DPMN_024205 [Dreissena polymorpha]|uniref:Uncharacterized protein n=1 Tax=Dreissena polymorpha TaxID=45954 RepID=A0A9D4LMJ1_DREPO|nr:hypothetical protein DPMN_024205 [Dreissena polymorpha]
MNIGQKNVSYRLFTCFHYIHIEKTAPPSGGHVFPHIMTIFELVRDIYKIDTNNVTSRVKMTHSGDHVFLPIRTIFKLNRHIQKTHVLTEFHEDWTKIVISRVFTCFHSIHIDKTAPPPGGHVFSPILTIFKLIRDINEINVLTKVHNDWAINVNTTPPPGGRVFQWTATIFELNHYIIKTNILTKLHEDWAANVTSTVFTSFELIRDNNVASRVFTRQNVDDARRTTHHGQKVITKAHHEHAVLR